MGNTGCVPCPTGTVASADRSRCIGNCDGPLDIILADGQCQTCCDGNVPDLSRTRCVKRNFLLLQQARAAGTGGDLECVGEREMYNADRTECVRCLPYTRGQDDNAACRADDCGDNQIITWLGTCADCEDGLSPDANKGSCVGPSDPIRLNALVDMEQESNEGAAEEAKPAKKRSFPTVIVTGLGIMVLVLAAATGVICYRTNRKSSGDANVEPEADENQAEEKEQEGEVASVEQHITDESGSPKSSSEDAKQ